MNTIQKPEVVVFKDSSELAEEAAHRFIRLAKEFIGSKGKFNVALSGGTTPLAMNKLLSTTFKDQVQWDKVYIYWGDERFVPITDPDSGYLFSYESLLKNVSVPNENIFRFPVELETPEKVAAAYEETLLRNLGTPIPRFDLLFLGMGQDGHTASLFPGLPAVHSAKLVDSVYNSPKPPPTRMTITLPVINNADNVIFLATGSDKSFVAGKILNSSPEAKNIPAGLVRPTHGTLTWLIDEKAAAEIKKS